jgi:hypothetical protein
MDLHGLLCGQLYFVTCRRCSYLTENTLIDFHGLSWTFYEVILQTSVATLSTYKVDVNKCEVNMKVVLQM